MGPIYMLCWHFFDSDYSGKYTAVVSKTFISYLFAVPMTFSIVFWLIGVGFLRIPLIADAMSRSGKAEELAAGPVHYGLCISLATVFFWKRIEALYCQSLSATGLQHFLDLEFEGIIS